MERRTLRTLSHRLQFMHKQVHQPGSQASPLLGQCHVRHVGSHSQEALGSDGLRQSPLCFPLAEGPLSLTFLICKMRSRTRKCGGRGREIVQARIALLLGTLPPVQDWLPATLQRSHLVVKCRSSGLSPPGFKPQLCCLLRDLA